MQPSSRSRLDEVRADNRPGRKSGRHCTPSFQDGRALRGRIGADGVGAVGVGPGGGFPTTKVAGGRVGGRDDEDRTDSFNDKEGDDDGIELPSACRPPSDRRYRKKILAPAGLKGKRRRGGGVDEAGEDKGVGRTDRPDVGRNDGGGGKGNENMHGRGDRRGEDLTKSGRRRKPATQDEEVVGGRRTANGDGGDSDYCYSSGDDETDTFFAEEDAAENGAGSVVAREQRSPFSNHCTWIALMVVSVVLLFYDDLAELASASNRTNAATPTSLGSKGGGGGKIIPDPRNKYGKDARVPDDDVVQSAGGVLGDLVYDEEESDATLQEIEQQQPPHHLSSGFFQEDKLWVDLSGYAELSEPFDSARDLPVFWHVPKCGGTTLQDLIIRCFGLVGANEVGKQFIEIDGGKSGSLEVHEVDNGNRYVNVDMSNPVGIQRAKDLGFGHSGMADVVMTSWFRDTALVFDGDNGGNGKGEGKGSDGSGGNARRGRCFSLLRHPIRRAVSMFYYLQDAKWEHTFSDLYSNMTVEEYAISEHSEDNWMVRFLTNEMSGALHDRHIDLAKRVLESKCLVGLMEDFDASVRRFDSYFGWSSSDVSFQGGPVKKADRAACEAHVESKPDNAHPHPVYEEGGKVWNLLMMKNRFDLELYEHARHLFYDVQAELV